MYEKFESQNIYVKYSQTHLYFTYIFSNYTQHNGLSHLKFKLFEYLKTMSITTIIQGVSKIFEKYQE
jgi:hypothetical protein